MDCIGALDYAELKDFCSVGLLFKKEEKEFLNNILLFMKRV
jgi:phage terminase large subunit-like protein